MFFGLLPMGPGHSAIMFQRLRRVPRVRRAGIASLRDPERDGGVRWARGSRQISFRRPRRYERFVRDTVGCMMVSASADAQVTFQVAPP
jgi:hypothetical protein